MSDPTYNTEILCSAELNKKKKNLCVLAENVTKRKTRIHNNKTMS